MSTPKDAATELLPCPFCGGSAVVEEIEKGTGPDVCFSCGCNSQSEDCCMGYQSFQTFSLRSDAIKAWNTRPAASLIEALSAEKAEPEALRKVAFNMSCRDQYRLAFFIAENLGYCLMKEPQDSDSPHAAPILTRSAELERAMEEIVRHPKMKERTKEDQSSYSVGWAFWNVQNIARAALAAESTVARPKAVTKSAPPLAPSHNSGERVPSSDAAHGGADTAEAIARLTSERDEARKEVEAERERCANVVRQHLVGWTLTPNGLAREDTAEQILEGILHPTQSDVGQRKDGDQRS
jgi:hypothetical protein